MAKVSKSFRLEQKMVEALNMLSPSGGMTSTLETLIFREAMYKLSGEELRKLFGEDYERLMLMYAISPKWIKTIGFIVGNVRNTLKSCRRGGDIRSMNIETKEMVDSLLKMLEEKGIALDPDAQTSIRKVVNQSYRDGYRNCLKDVREGLMK